MKRLTEILLPVAMLMGSWGLAAEAGWQAGVSETIITPSTPMPMAGYASRGAKPADGKHTDLFAKVLIIKDEAKTELVFVTLDLVGIDAETSEKIYQNLYQRHGWKREQVAILTSHTHSGPVVGKILAPMHFYLFEEKDQKLINDYTVELVKNIGDGAEKAAKNMQAVELKWGSGEADFAVNRRNNLEANVPALREKGELKGPSDHAVPVLTAWHGKQLKAILFGYACHSTVLSGQEWSGDYPGVAQRELQERFPGSVALFWAGCGADQNPLPRRSVDLAESYGTKLAAAVETVVSTSLKPVTGHLKAAFKTVTLDFAAIPTKEQLEQTTQSTNKFEVARAKYLLRVLQDQEAIDKNYAFPVFAWKIGDAVSFVQLGGETVVDYAIRIKSDFGEGHPDHVWVAAYANDVMAYIPSRRVLLEGGYEGGGAMVYYGLPSPWAPSIEDNIMRTVSELIQQVSAPVAVTK